MEDNNQILYKGLLLILNIGTRIDPTKYLKIGVISLLNKSAFLILPGVTMVKKAF